MKIQQIYEKYKIPPNLQLHMYRVASLASIISDNFDGKTINKNEITSACLLHDMGNILKFDFVNAAHLLGDEIKNIEFWKKIQGQYKEKYGPDEDIATVEICKELEIDENIFFIIENWGFGNFKRISESDNWNWKIAVYADHRISPNGVVSLDENLENKRKRYKHNRKGSSHLSTEAESLLQAAKEVETQIQTFSQIKLEDLNTGQIDLEISKIKDFEID